MADKRILIGKILVDKGVLTPEKLQECLLVQKGSGLKIGQMIIKKNYAEEKDVLEALALQNGLKFMPLLDFHDENKILLSLPPHFLKSNRLVPFHVKDDKIKVALDDVFNIQPLDDLRRLFPSYKIERVLSTGHEISRLLNSHFESAETASTEDIIEDLEESDFEILSTTASEITDLLDMANEAPIIRLVNTIIRQAVSERASDIHFEIFEKDIVVRFRIDGILYKMYTPPKKYQEAVISRVKIMANLNIAENRLPQDGRIQIKIGGKEIDIRVSAIPTHYGERLVLRLLNKSDIDFSLDSLGFSKAMLKKYDELINITHGIILVTGPTGSGKSTTLYSMLTRLNSKEVNILTVEDPIEYQIYGIGQMQIRPKIGLTFASGLRSILRQDPDIIMVGEIRDTETAQIAVQSALTGHRVFSTIHTNDAASGVTRLMDMGIEPFLITSSVNAFLAQRLVRKICPACMEPYKPDSKELLRAGIMKSSLKKGVLYKGKGCDKCLNTGYSGRIGIFELLPLPDEIKRLIMTREDAGKIKAQGIKEGMVLLLEDGISKVIDGITTLEEVMRVS
ncbi:MAG: type II secretion system ATPase GspE [Spirochaetota bacterium]